MVLGLRDSGEEKSFGPLDSSEAEQPFRLTIRNTIAPRRVMLVKKPEYRITLVLELQFEESVFDILAIRRRIVKNFLQFR